MRTLSESIFKSTKILFSRRPKESDLRQLELHLWHLFTMGMVAFFLASTAVAVIFISYCFIEQVLGREIQFDVLETLIPFVCIPVMFLLIITILHIHVFLKLTKIKAIKFSTRDETNSDEIELTQKYRFFRIVEISPLLSFYVMLVFLLLLPPHLAFAKLIATGFLLEKYAKIMTSLHASLIFYMLLMTLGLLLIAISIRLFCGRNK